MLALKICYLIFELFLTKWLSENFDWMHLDKIVLGEGLVCLQSLLMLKKEPMSVSDPIEGG